MADVHQIRTRRRLDLTHDLELLNPHLAKGYSIAARITAPK